MQHMYSVWNVQCLVCYMYTFCPMPTACQPIPDNVFIVAACNPHRGHSMIAMEKDKPYESWMRTSYNVHRLHPTIQYLMWNYGALNTEQEEQYIKAKMKMTSHNMIKIVWCVGCISCANVSGAAWSWLCDIHG